MITPINSFSRQGYEWLIRKGLKEGFSYMPLDGRTTTGKIIFLRHDVDFSLECALKIAESNSELGVNSTFFVMLSNPFYNLFESGSRMKLSKIKDMGHTISLHYDETQYVEKHFGLEIELKCFKNLTGCEPEIISLHRPSKSFLENRWTEQVGVKTTYDKEYFNDITYLSDSAKKFDRERTIQELERRGQERRIQLLLHPLWWSRNEESSTNRIIDEIIDSKKKSLEQWSKINCKSYL